MIIMIIMIIMYVISISPGPKKNHALPPKTCGIRSPQIRTTSTFSKNIITISLMSYLFDTPQTFLGFRLKAPFCTLSSRTVPMMAL